MGSAGSRLVSSRPLKLARRRFSAKCACEGKACSYDREGVPGGGLEAERLKLPACLVCICSPWICRGIDTEVRSKAPVQSLYMSGFLTASEGGSLFLLGR